MCFVYLSKLTEPDFWPKYVAVRTFQLITVTKLGGGLQTALKESLFPGEIAILVTDREEVQSLGLCTLQGKGPYL